MVRELTLEEYDLSYQRYLANSIENQEMINNIYGSLNESGELEPVTEGVIDTIKGFIQKIMDAIAKVWEKFVKAVNNLFTNNNHWLTKYKDIILNKKPIDATLNDFYDYDVEKIKSTDVPKLDDPIKLELDTKEKYIDSVQMFKEMMKDDKQSFMDNVKAVLRGGDKKTISSNQLDMKKMYEYCMNYNKEIKDKIYQSIDNLKESNKKAFNICNKLARGAKSTFKAKDNVQKTEEKPAEGNTNNTTQEPEKKEETTNNASFTYADTMAYYFNEEVGIENKEDAPADKKDDNAATNTATDGNQDQKADDETKKTEAAIKAYFNACSEFLGAKLNIANEAYKTFIKIMKWHVKNYDKNADLEPKNREGEENGKNDTNGENNTGNGGTNQQKGQEAQNNSASLSDSEEVTSFSENENIEDRFDSSFLEAVTSKFGSVDDRTEPDDPFKGLSFM